MCLTHIEYNGRNIVPVILIERKEIRQKWMKRRETDINRQKKTVMDINSQKHTETHMNRLMSFGSICIFAIFAF